MIQLLKPLFALAVLYAMFEFASNPRAALHSASSVLTTPTPRFFPTTEKKHSPSSVVHAPATWIGRGSDGDE